MRLRGAQRCSGRMLSHEPIPNISPQNLPSQRAGRTPSPNIHPYKNQGETPIQSTTVLVGMQFELLSFPMVQWGKVGQTGYLVMIMEMPASATARAMHRVTEAC